jgi:membrane protein
LTFYAAIGLIPLFLIGLRLTSLLVGPAAVRQTGDALAHYTPSRLGVGDAIRTLGEVGGRVGWSSVLAALLPASLYADGLTRVLHRYAPEGMRNTRPWRSRLYTVVLVGVVTCGVVVLTGFLRPLLVDPFGTGAGARFLGILVAFVFGWVGFIAVLTLIYRVFGGGHASLPAVVWAAAATGSWLSGQTLGFLLVLRLATGVGTAYGGSVVAGAASTVLFLLYLDNVVLIGGYALALAVEDVRDTGAQRVSALPAAAPQPPAAAG